MPAPPEKLQCQSPATIRQTQKMKTSLSLLLLLLGLSQAQPLVEEGSADDVEEDNEDMDISTRILTPTMAPVRCCWRETWFSLQLECHDVLEQQLPMEKILQRPCDHSLHSEQGLLLLG
ncbi:hypothetical protein N1851_002122 [Merluccius polli]|uniref:Uncharacterized protein n=1 Tax=Merluccius polli TaxID=89951 RepID=A0AA47NAI0_MERPO|nr:hypothetical protein N1851_002122 [Merluccius polli]